MFDTDSLVPLWTIWHKHLRQYYLFAYDGKPAKTSPGWADKDSMDKFGAREHMLKEMDTQVQARWAQAKLRDDDRRLAAQKVVEDWEAKRASFEYKTDGGKHDKGLSVYQVGKGVKDAMEEGAVITVKKCKIERERERLQCLSQPASLITYRRRQRLNVENIKTVQNELENLHMILLCKKGSHGVAYFAVLRI